MAENLNNDKMQSIKLDLSKYICGSENSELGADIKFSMKPFVDFLTAKSNEDTSARKNIYTYVLQEFAAFPELENNIEEENTARYAKLFDLIHTLVSPLLQREGQQLWAISKPVCPCFYYGSDAFYSVLLDKKKHHINQNLSLPSTGEMERSMLGNFYNLILQEFYQFSLNLEQHIVHSVLDLETNLLKYYRLDVDSRFLKIRAQQALPELSLDVVKKFLDGEEDYLKILKDVLPPEMFTIEGMSIVTLTDATAEYALESVKSTIISHNQCKSGWDFPAIHMALKALVCNNQLEFSLLPFLKLNQKSLLFDHDGFHSVLIELAKESGMLAAEYDNLIEKFLQQPKRIIYPEINEEVCAEIPMLRLLLDNGIKSFALYPLYYNGKIVGCLEMYSRSFGAFNPQTISSIEFAFPLLAQLYQNIIMDFNNEISAIITDQFTAIQPSVQWRFIEAAYNYLKSGSLEKKLQIEPVNFKDVHPFYGAVDIRNSSIQRNLMIRKDLFDHFRLLESTLAQLQPVLCGSLTEVLGKKLSVWDEQHFSELSDMEVMKTDDYLRRQLPVHLEVLKEQHPETKTVIDRYLADSKSGGKVFINRDRYELSMQMINHAVSRQLDEFNQTIQDLYPCYFEKFRTDGVEFDIYLGQSIAPGTPFPDFMVSVFRYQQLRVIAEIAHITANLHSHLPLPLETTQLIFVYGKQLDISFRLDEQRFDVEGSYNIRYQMVKKRIDKANIKGTTERLTQPGKIAIVYFNQSEAHEYLKHIRRLQTEELLSGEIEYLEVEELQGVEGLKALRVSISQNPL
ncbi:hypothetical protein SAMN03003324_02822 [Pedobacter antarcticus]|nr:GAF domain-containing protein [Pedobacter antarcticus]SFF20205.1 hypothetical protein SAMN03003324_02822 [Pedobacter antarcticus]